MFIRKSVHKKRMKVEHNAWLAEIEWLRNYWHQKIDDEYRKAQTDLSATLREILLEFNYNIFHTDNSLLRSKVNGFTTSVLAEFHEKAKNGTIRH